MSADSAPWIVDSPFARKAATENGHGDAMISAGVDLGASAVPDLRARRGRLPLRSLPRPSGADFRTSAMRSDSLTRNSWRHECGSLLCIRRNGCKDRQFINELRGERARYGGAAQTVLRRDKLHGSGEFAAALLQIENGGVRAERRQHVEQRGTRRV